MGLGEHNSLLKPAPPLLHHQQMSPLAAFCCAKAAPVAARITSQTSTFHLA